ncbi:MAG: HAD-IIIC family phosphatase [Muribaculaceae bacterium]|nr:HAD-IIIC family phosphatase [Muribaculaceae bacterium]
MKSFIFRNQTVEPFFDEKGVVFSGYDDISVIPEQAEVFIWFYQVPPGESAIVSKEVDTYIEKFKMVLSRVEQDKQIVVFTLYPLANTNIVSGNTDLLLVIENFNCQVAEISKEHKNVRIVDFSEFTRRYPQEELVNWKFFFISQTLLSPKLAKDFNRWWQRTECELALKRKKCLVLDLDNTLWGGVLGEEGVAGIKIGGDYPGKAFTYWQQALMNLKNSGVMLAVCSKNNEQDVFEVWDKNPYLILRKDNFVAWRINWQDKATNLQELAAELNIGLDSMVFVDDNPAERELIKQLLPMVEVPEFPAKPYQLMDFFRRLVEDYFRVYSVTNEDLKKTEQYKANAQRAAEQTKFSDFDDYLRSLDVKIDILPLDLFNLPRVAQMTQKTNQFNLTTHRYTENDIQQMANEGALIYVISVSDKFGDSGITGEIILRPKDKESMIIDTLLLSCRILGKGIEFAFLDVILNLLVAKGIKSVEASYVKTAKNAQVADFFDRAGFVLTDATDNEKNYYLELTQQRTIKDCFSITIK